jgi:hypothetical protein
MSYTEKLTQKLNQNKESRKLKEQQQTKKLAQLYVFNSSKRLKSLFELLNTYSWASFFVKYNFINKNY